MQGKYVVIEGCDGSGKTTIVDQLEKAIKKIAHSKVRRLAFPGRDSAVGRLIRDVFEGKTAVSPIAMMWLFIAEGKDMEAQIRSHIAAGDWIICDRHTMVSGLIYQSETHGYAAVETAQQLAKFQAPDRIYVVDVPAEIGLARRTQRGEARNMLYESEQIERLEGRRVEYKTIATSGQLGVVGTIIDGTRPTVDSVHAIWRDLGLPGNPVI